MALNWFQEWGTRPEIMTRWNIMTKMLSLLLLTRKFQGFWEMWAEIHEGRLNIYWSSKWPKYISHKITVSWPQKKNSISNLKVPFQGLNSAIFLGSWFECWDQYFKKKMSNWLLPYLTLSYINCKLLEIVIDIEDGITKCFELNLCSTAIWVQAAQWNWKRLRCISCLKCYFIWTKFQMY